LCRPSPRPSLLLQTLTGRDGKISKLDFVYIRGSKIRLMILPDMLKNAPLFKRFDVKNAVSKSQAGLGFGYGGITSVVSGGRGRGGAPGGGRGRGRGQ
jgi:small nuclear ribonucleoprotein D3